MIKSWNKDSEDLININDNLVELLTKINISCQGTVNPGPEIDRKNLEIYSKQFQKNIKSAIEIVRKMLKLEENLTDDGLKFFKFMLNQFKEFIEIVCLERKLQNGTFLCPFPPSKAAYESVCFAYKEIIENELLKKINFMIMLNKIPLGSTKSSLRKGGKTKKHYRKKKTKREKNKKGKNKRRKTKRKTRRKLR